MQINRLVCGEGTYNIMAKLDSQNQDFLGLKSIVKPADWIVISEIFSCFPSGLPSQRWAAYIFIQKFSYRRVRLYSRASLLSVCVSECVVSTACISLYLHALRKALDRIDCSLRGNKFCRQRIISAIVVGYTEAVPLPSTSTSISLPSLVHNKPTTSIRIEG